MKIIDLLNKIANGEIETFYKFKYRNKIVTIEFLINNYLFLEILNDEIEFIEDDIKEEKKIPEKLDIQIQNETTGNAYIINEYGTKCYLTKHSKILANKINEIIDYLESKGE